MKNKFEDPYLFVRGVGKDKDGNDNPDVFHRELSYNKGQWEYEGLSINILKQYFFKNKYDYDPVFVGDMEQLVEKHSKYEHTDRFFTSMFELYIHLLESMIYCQEYSSELESTKNSKKADKQAEQACTNFKKFLKGK